MRLAFTFDERKNAAVAVTASTPIAGTCAAVAQNGTCVTTSGGLDGGATKRLVSHVTFIRTRALSAFNDGREAAVRLRRIFAAAR